MAPKELLDIGIGVDGAGTSPVCVCSCWTGGCSCVARISGTSTAPFSVLLLSLEVRGSNNGARRFREARELPVSTKHIRNVIYHIVTGFNVLAYRVHHPRMAEEAKRLEATAEKRRERAENSTTCCQRQRWRSRWRSQSARMNRTRTKTA